MSENTPEFEPKNEPANEPPTEFVEDLDAYQKRLDLAWEKAKRSYEGKIDQIMEEFLRPMPGDSPAAPPTSPKDTPPFSPSAFDRKSENRENFDQLIRRMERDLHDFEEKKQEVSYLPERNPALLTYSWPLAQRILHSRTIKGLALLVFVGATVLGGYLWWAAVPSSTPLPYLHASAPIIDGGRVYITDWFRRAYYVHSLRRGLPILAVENLPNNLTAGVARANAVLWSVDGLDHTMLQHTSTADHQVVETHSLPGPKPEGLFFDGKDFWVGDNDEHKLYRLRGNDVEDIRDAYPLPENVTVTGVSVKDGRAWILDGKSREIQVYRLQKPPKLLSTYDLDPILKGASATGFFIQGKTVWITTEYPSTIRRVRFNQLKTAE